jgi:hypothetical protein
MFAARTFHLPKNGPSTNLNASVPEYLRGTYKIEAGEIYIVDQNKNEYCIKTRVGTDRYTHRHLRLTAAVLTM